MKNPSKRDFSFFSNEIDVWCVYMVNTKKTQEKGIQT
jgi:hypothetical protein